MQRRSFLALLGGAAAAWPLAARAQQDDRVRALQMRVLRLQAEALAAKTSQFFAEIVSQVGWTTQLPWTASNIDQRRFDGLRLLRQVPAITDIVQLDALGKEQLRSVRLAMGVVASGTDYSQDPKFTVAMANGVYYGAPYLRRQSEPFMTLSVAGRRRDCVTVVEVGLKLIWDLVMVKVGERGVAYVVDAEGRIIAHPDVSLARRNEDFSSLPQVRAARGIGSNARVARAMSAQDINGREVLVAYTTVSPLGWLVFAEVPVEDADALAR